MVIRADLLPMSLLVDSHNVGHILSSLALLFLSSTVISCTFLLVVEHALVSNVSITFTMDLTVPLWIAPQLIIILKALPTLQFPYTY
jgi:hypothetical protein